MVFLPAETAAVSNKPCLSKTGLSSRKSWAKFSLSSGLPGLSARPPNGDEKKKGVRDFVIFANWLNCLFTYKTREISWRFWRWKLSFRSVDSVGVGHNFYKQRSKTEREDHKDLWKFQEKRSIGSRKGHKITQKRATLSKYINVINIGSHRLCKRLTRPGNPSFFVPLI